MLTSVGFSILNEIIPYTGAELRPHWVLEQTKKYGSQIVAFIGPCSVLTEHLVDQEDRLAADFIKANLMLHFIGEFFGTNLETTVFIQRLFIATILAELQRAGLKDLIRTGDDLFIAEKKLSVSIATVSVTSTLMHVGINIDFTGAPVSAIGLKDLLNWNRSDCLTFAKELLDRYTFELEDIRKAQMKVRSV